jgi:mannose-6-phosphate isomerase-like protein (cupin superfamily)
MKLLENAGKFAPSPDGRPSWVEQFRVEALSVGTYSVPEGGIDAQSPHTEDEIYVVTSGTGVIEAAGERAAVQPGSVVYVPAHEPHRFVETTGEFAVLVFFAPAEYSQAGEA